MNNLFFVEKKIFKNNNTYRLLLDYNINNKSFKFGIDDKIKDFSIYDFNLEQFDNLFSCIEYVFINNNDLSIDEYFFKAYTLIENENIKNKERKRNFVDLLKKNQEKTLENKSIYKIGFAPNVFNRIKEKNEEGMLFISGHFIEDAKKEHHIPSDKLYRIIDNLHNPVAIFRGRYKDTYIVVTDYTDENDDNAIIPIKVNEEKGQIILDKLITIYPRKDINEYILTLIYNNDLIAFNEKKVKDSLFRFRDISNINYLKSASTYDENVSYFNEIVNSGNKEIICLPVVEKSALINKVFSLHISKIDLLEIGMSNKDIEICFLDKNLISIENIEKIISNRCHYIEKDYNRFTEKKRYKNDMEKYMYSLDDVVLNAQEIREKYGYNEYVQQINKTYYKINNEKNKKKRGKYE